MTLQLLHFEFPYTVYEENLIFFFIFLFYLSFSLTPSKRHVSKALVIVSFLKEAHRIASLSARRQQSETSLIIKSPHWQTF
jgi:hypothetical protein